MDVEKITVISIKECPKAFLIREYLHRNLVPFQYFEYPENREARQLIEDCKKDENSFPLVIFKDNSFKTDPQLFEIALHLGHHQKPQRNHYDLVIMGAGPAGLTAAVYGGSEGLKTVLIERHSPGGRAGSTSLIKNLIGHPKGITGGDFTKASIEQAEKFGVEFVSPVELLEVKKEGDLLKIFLSGDVTITCVSLIIAVGVRYQLLELPNAERLTGAGIFYGAAMTEGINSTGKEVYIVGGANSAGQAALYFAKFASKVNLIVRADTLRKRMSHYLIEEILQQPNINVQVNTEVVSVSGDRYLSSIDIKNLKTGIISNIITDNLFLLIGGVPCTECLTGIFMRDRHGFLLTGTNLESHSEYKSFWQLPRKPFHLETNIPGVMAIGDVRHGSVKRMAAAIGDGATAVTLVHDYIASIHKK